MVAAGCKPKGCNQPRAAPWVGGNALIKVSRSARAACFMRGNAPWHCGLRARGAWHFCAIGAKMPNVLIAAYVPPGVARGYGQHLGLQPALTIAIRRVRRASSQSSSYSLTAFWQGSSDAPPSALPFRCAGERGRGSRTGNRG